MNTTRYCCMIPGVYRTAEMCVAIVVARELGIRVDEHPDNPGWMRVFCSFPDFRALCSLAGIP